MRRYWAWFLLTFWLATGLSQAQSGTSGLAYEFIVGSTARSVLPSDTLSLPQTNVGDKTTASMRIRNTGNGEVSIGLLASSSPAFLLDSVPFLPITLRIGESISFNINFTPTQPGITTARVQVGGVSFNLSGLGLGATLTYATVIGSASTTLTPNGAVIFTPTPVGSTSTVQLQIGNTGNIAAFINSISVAAPGAGVFTATNVPALPVRIDSGATVSFAIAFAPSVLGENAGTLKIDSQVFTLSGVGNAPPPLPGVTFVGVSPVVDASQQIGVGITLDTTYPVQLNGKLFLTFASSADVFSDDPAIAFASGGRTVNFVVPANSKNAVFGLSDNAARFQTGTIAGSITLAATFATDGGINLTLTAVPAINVSIRPSPVRITSVQLANRTASSISILVTGYSSTRSVNTMSFSFVPFIDPNNKDMKLETTGLNLTVDGPFSVWYQSAASQPFGSLFTATITFVVHGNIEAIQSIAVTMNNRIGTSSSNAVTLK